MLVRQRQLSHPKIGQAIALTTNFDYPDKYFVGFWAVIRAKTSWQIEFSSLYNLIQYHTCDLIALLSDTVFIINII